MSIPSDISFQKVRGMTRLLMCIWSVTFFVTVHITWPGNSKSAISMYCQDGWPNLLGRGLRYWFARSVVFLWWRGNAIAGITLINENSGGFDFLFVCSDDDHKRDTWYCGKVRVCKLKKSWVSSVVPLVHQAMNNGCQTF